MYVNITCKSDMTNISEFSIHKGCDIPKLVYLIFKYLNIIVPILLFLVQIFILVRRWKYVTKTKLFVKLLILQTMTRKFLAILRPILSIALNRTCVNSIPIATLTFLSGLWGANIAIQYVYFDAQLIYRATLGNKKSCFLRNRLTILVTAAVIQSLLFISGIIIPIYTNIPYYITFWIPVIFIDFTVIPYLGALNLKIISMINNMERKDIYRKLVRHMVITSVGCLVLGLFTGSVGVFSIFNQYIEWLLVELCFLSDDAFDFMIFTMITRKKVKYVSKNSTSENVTIGSTTSSGKSSKSIKVVSSVEEVLRAEAPPAGSQT